MTKTNALQHFNDIIEDRTEVDFSAMTPEERTGFCLALAILATEYANDEQNF